MMHRAGELRHSQTEAEAKLWLHLRAHRMAGVQFRRQHAIGNYVVDFCAPRRKLIHPSCDLPKEIDRAGENKESDFDLKAFGSDRMNRFW